MNQGFASVLSSHTSTMVTIPIQYYIHDGLYDNISISLIFLFLCFYQSSRTIHRLLPVDVNAYLHHTQLHIILFVKHTQNHKQKPVYSTKSIPRLISTLPKLPPWINFPTVTKKCTAVAGNLVHFHCVMDLTWLITRRLGITLVL